MIAPVFLAGVAIPDRHVLALARRLRARGFRLEARRLEQARRDKVIVFAPGLGDREAILQACEECPPELAELHAALLRDIEWFRRG